MDFKTLEQNILQIADRLCEVTDDPRRVILSNRELQEKLGVSRKTAQKWRDTGVIAYSKIGREIFYKFSDILEMLDRYRTPAINSNFNHINNNHKSK